MAFQLVSLILAAAVGGGPHVTYRNGVVAAVDPVRRIVSVDLPDGLTPLVAGPGVDLAALRPGDAVMVGVREVDGRSEAVRIRTAVASEGARPAADERPPGSTTPLASGAPRRPLHVIPDHGAPDARGDGLANAKVPAVSIVPAPDEPRAEAEPPTPSRVERLREEGQRALAAALETVDVLAHTADRAWGRYLGASCPALGADGPRAWLALPANASAPPGVCTQLLEGVNAAAGRVRERLAAVEDRARADWVPPGVVRRMLAAHGLE